MGHDDELSIALIAFDEAIDAYKKSKGGSFNLLCRLVIKRRLIDYFRQVEKYDDIPDTDRLVSSAAFNEEWERSEREREIEKYSQLLNARDKKDELGKSEEEERSSVAEEVLEVLGGDSSPGDDNFEENVSSQAQEDGRGLGEKVSEAAKEKDKELGGITPDAAGNANSKAGNGR